MFGISACLKDRAMNSDVPVRRAVIRGYAIPMPGTRYPAPCTRYAARCPEPGYPAPGTRYAARCPEPVAETIQLFFRVRESLTAGARSAGGVGRWERVRVRRAADGS